MEFYQDFQPLPLTLEPKDLFYAKHTDNLNKNGRYFEDDIFKYILNEYYYIW